MTKKIRKAVFPVAGLGTRFLPATKAMPKEMLPVVDKPLIQYAVEEARASGVEHFIFVTGHGKTAIEDHFDTNTFLSDKLVQSGRGDLLALLKQCSFDAGEISYIRQGSPKGLGHAILCAKNLIGDEPFAVLLPDDLFLCETPCLKQLIEVYEETGGHVAAVQNVPKEQASRYGILDVLSDDGKRVKAKGLVEKPPVDKAPSSLAISGRYILSPQVFDALEKNQTQAGEMQLTDALAACMQKVRFFGVRYDGRRFDCGDKIGFLTATVEFALQRDDLKDEFRKVLQSLSL